MNICLFTADEINNPLPLRDERARHIVKILHKKTGDTFSAGVIGGTAGKALITEKGFRPLRSSSAFRARSSSSVFCATSRVSAFRTFF